MFVQVLLSLPSPPEGTMILKYSCSARTARPTLPSSTWTDLLCINDHSQCNCNEAKVSVNCWIYHTCHDSWFFTSSSTCQNSHHLSSRSKILPFMGKLLLSWNIFFPTFGLRFWNFPLSFYWTLFNFTIHAIVSCLPWKVNMLWSQLPDFVNY